MPVVRVNLAIDTDKLDPNTFRQDIAKEFTRIHKALCDRIALEFPEPSRIILSENSGKVVVP